MSSAVEAPAPAGIVAQNAEVFYGPGGMFAVGRREIDWLKAQAGANARRRSRLCLHPNPAADVHEMIIVHQRDVYVRPHRHCKRLESFARIEGEAAIVFFDASGCIESVFEIDADPASPFHVRIPADVYHAYVIRSEWLVFTETTAGPFDRSQMQFAAWSPDETDPSAVAVFSARLLDDIESFHAGVRARSERF